ncbi:MAG: winged helix-turn-helix domain-containing protein [Bacteroidales bacterium]
MDNKMDHVKYSNVQVYYHIWLETENQQIALGDDTWALLLAVAEKGSLVKAAASLDISYRKAWGDLKRTEELLGFSLIEKHRGGAKGGETILSEEGKAFIDAYNQFHLEVEEAIQPAVIRFKRKIKGKSQKNDL